MKIDNLKVVGVFIFIVFSISFFSQNDSSVKTIFKQSRSTASSNSAKDGVVGSGGGNHTTDNIEKLIVALGVHQDSKDTFDIKYQLIGLTRTLKSIMPSNETGETWSKVLAMINTSYSDQSVFEQDVWSSKYILSQRCEENGIEKSASTQKINLRENPTLSSPSICINVTKIAREGFTVSQLLGLLMHEHSRHFGFEDTDNLGRHPIEYATIKWADKLFEVWNGALLNISTISKNNFIWGKGFIFNIVARAFFTDPSQSITFKLWAPHNENSSEYLKYQFEIENQDGYSFESGPIQKNPMNTPLTLTLNNPNLRANFYPPMTITGNLKAEFQEVELTLPDNSKYTTFNLKSELTGGGGMVIRKIGIKFPSVELIKIQ